MAIQLDVSTIQHNHRALYFECVGDGAATTVKVPHMRITRPTMNATSVSSVTAPTAHNSTHSQGGGLPVKSGTAQAVSSVAVNADGTLTMTFTAAPANAARVYVNVLHSQTID